MRRLSWHSKCLDFFLFSFVPNMFPMCSPGLFTIAPHFNPICFAQSPPLLTYIGGTKGEAIHLSIESSILGSFHILTFFWDGQSNWLIAKKKLDLWTFIGTVHIAAAVIGWRRSGKEMRGQTQFRTKFAANLSFMAGWSPVTFFSPFFDISSPMWPHRGFQCRLFLTLRITLFCFWIASLFFQLFLWY
jgi:hypothetical protein